jgi:hypothetical protein
MGIYTSTPPYALLEVIKYCNIINESAGVCFWHYHSRTSIVTEPRCSPPLSENGDSVIGDGITKRYGLDGRGSIPGSSNFVYSPLCTDRLLGPPSLLSIGYRE